MGGRSSEGMRVGSERIAGKEQWRNDSLPFVTHEGNEAESGGGAGVGTVGSSPYLSGQNYTAR